MKKAIIFDFGGTIDTGGIHWSVMFEDAYKKAGLNIPEEKFNRAYVQADDDLKKIAKDGIKSYPDLLKKQTELQFKYLDKEKERETINKIADYIVKEMNDSVEISKSILTGLKKKYSLALVSNFYGNLEEMCASIGLCEFFDVLIDSEKEGIEKPHPGIFSLALKKMNANPENTYVVGDSYERDIVPAKILGCKTIWLKNKSFKENKETDSADYIIGDLKELSGRLS
ncbi:MAG: HAD family hydrolase [Ignavibacteriae bacterium]|nr:HAD family hydrolase [Ignavibacteriota bacterium]